ncbi:MAG TPA: sulfotransferase [Candidatus Polarisedimenticolaceae bacterium]|nr:sulfotransferase [Candidatus Polarisedimenticolaceae bacterium]
MSRRLTYERVRLPLLMRACNRVARGAARLGLAAAPMRAESILRRATKRSGLADFGDGDVGEPLAVLVDSLEHEAALTPLGHKSIEFALVETLAKRLRIVDHVARHPAVGRQTIERPVFVVGFPRSGTTLLFNLLAQDPAARPLLGWEASEPLPRRPPRPGRRDPRIRRHRRSLRRLDHIVPELRKVHELTAEGPEECNLLLMRSLVTWFYGLLTRVPSYERWLASRPRSTFNAAYRLHRAQLQALQHQRRGERWLLKSPLHLNTLDALVEVYPDACIVQTHRDPAKVHPSSCSLIALTRSIFSDRIDPVAIGREALDEGLRRVDRLLAMRETLSADRVYDVRYAELTDDPPRTLRAIYDHFGLSWPDGMERRVRGWLASSPRHKHGVHRYALEAFGTTAAEIDRLSSGYRERFGVPRER